MKRSDYLKELREKSCDELKSEARRIADEMMKVGFRRAVGRDEANSQGALLRKNLARVYTVLSAKEKETSK